MIALAVALALACFTVLFAVAFALGVNRNWSSSPFRPGKVSPRQQKSADESRFSVTGQPRHSTKTSFENSAPDPVA
jgi:hypothetical protein